MDHGALAWCWCVSCFQHRIDKIWWVSISPFYLRWCICTIALAATASRARSSAREELTPYTVLRCRWRKQTHWCWIHRLRRSNKILHHVGRISLVLTYINQVWNCSIDMNDGFPEYLFTEHAPWSHCRVTGSEITMFPWWCHREKPKQCNKQSHTAHNLQVAISSSSWASAASTMNQITFCDSFAKFLH